MPKEYSGIEQNLYNWAQNKPDIRSVFVIGSRGRSNKQSKDGSDLDVLIICQNPKLYQGKGTAWMEEIAPLMLSKQNYDQHMVLSDSIDYSAIFKPNLDVEITLVKRLSFLRQLGLLKIPDRTTWAVSKLQFQKNVAMIYAFRDGFRVIFDRDNLKPKVEQMVRKKIPSQPFKNGREFSEKIEAFLIFGYKCSQKIISGELYSAKWICDVTMNILLVELFQWHRMALQNSSEISIYPELKPMDWVDSRIASEIPNLFSPYDAKRIAKVLKGKIDLAYWVCAEIASALKFDDLMDKAVDQFEWLRKYIEEL